LTVGPYTLVVDKWKEEKKREKGRWCVKGTEARQKMSRIRKITINEKTTSEGKVVLTNAME